VTREQDTWTVTKRLTADEQLWQKMADAVDRAKKHHSPAISQAGKQLRSRLQWIQRTLNRA